MMNILFLTPRDSKTNLGGVERHVKLLTEELERRGHQVKELSPDVAKIAKISEKREQKEKKDQKDRKVEGKSQKDRKVGKFRAWRYLWEKRELLRWADIIHVHDVFWWYAPFALIAKIAKISENREPRVFVTFHGWEGKYPPTKSGVWQKWLAARLSAGTIGVGNFFEKWYGVKTDRVVWGAIDPRIAKIAKVSENRERGVYKGPTPMLHRGRTLGTGNKIVFFGRMEEVNGIEMVIESIAKIAKISENREQVIFVGDGSYRKPAESVGKVTGMVAEPWKYLAGADVVIASSYLAILEAAALGKRIIAVANNPLKRDYLEGHPLRDYFKIVSSMDELVGEIMKVVSPPSLTSGLLGTIRTRPEERLVGGFGRASGFLPRKNPGPSEKGYKNNKEGEREKGEKEQKDEKEKGKTQKDKKGEGNTWALGQTAEKLADEYEKLWRGGGDE